MSDRFELEQRILECGQITDDIINMVDAGADQDDMISLALIYAYKFRRLWQTFETMVSTDQFKEESSIDERMRNRSTYFGNNP